MHDAVARRMESSVTWRRSPGSKRTAVPDGMSRRMPYACVSVEPQCGVDLEEVEVGADLDRAGRRC